MSAASTAGLVDQGIAALRAGDRPRAFELLVQALRQEPRSELGWLWLSGVVIGKAEQRYCLERVLEINPHNPGARNGMRTFPADLVAQPPFHTQPVSPPAPAAAAVPATPAVTGNMLAVPALAEEVGLSVRQLYLLLADLGWVTQQEDGWMPTERGQALGALQRVYPKSGVAFVVLPEQILQHRAVRSALQSGASAAPADPVARYRTIDGHMVACQAEVLIDNWLYLSGLAHACAHPLPLEEEARGDFYLPRGQLYIEYAGAERDPAATAQREARRALYATNHLNLIELSDQQVSSLDDYLPNLLLRFGVDVP